MTITFSAAMLNIKTNFLKAALEVSYPPIRGITPGKDVGQTILYIFYFALMAVGVLALFSLILAGFQYISSGGEPERQKKAKEKIKSAFLGILILLLSYIFLNTLHPSFVQISPKELEKLKGEPFKPLPSLEEMGLSTAASVNPFSRIASTTQMVDEDNGKIKEQLEHLLELFQNCSCERTMSECGCAGGCTAFRCYGEPCENKTEIEQTEKKLAVGKMLSFYHSSLFETEKGILVKESGELTDWAKKLIDSNFLLKKEEKEEMERRLNEAGEDLAKRAEIEKEYKQLQEDRIRTMASLLSRLSEKSKEVIKLTDELFDLTRNCNLKVCQPSCEGGCHDAPSCSPLNCSGGNPCPIDAIQEKISEIESVLGQMQDFSQNLGDIISIPSTP
jgi:hypothetical protein